MKHNARNFLTIILTDHQTTKHRLAYFQIPREATVKKLITNTSLDLQRNKYIRSHSPLIYAQSRLISDKLISLPETFSHRKNAKVNCKQLCVKRRQTFSSDLLGFTLQRTNFFPGGGRERLPYLTTLNL